MNWLSQESVGFGRKLAVISCAWLCWIWVRVAWILGLLASASVMAWSKVISSGAGVGNGWADGAPPGALWAGAPAAWRPEALERVNGNVVCPNMSSGSRKSDSKRDAPDISLPSK